MAPENTPRLNETLVTHQPHEIIQTVHLSQNGAPVLPTPEEVVPEGPVVSEFTQAMPLSLEAAREAVDQATKAQNAIPTLQQPMPATSESLQVHGVSQVH